ncbi:MAG: alanine dehydrogenase [Bacteroidia bacterium]|nr:alanine dehydrogenase [Bacteroidia bacterium]
MTKIKIGILREGKIPHDHRVPFTPEQCKQLKIEYPDCELVVQQSGHRCFSNAEYLAEGINVTDDISGCDFLIGIKEVPITELIPSKTYMIFSHTIKKQPHNKKLIETIIEKQITLIDYECLVDKNDNRIIGFGRFAGIVGAYNGVMGYGLKYKLFNLKPAHLSKDKAEVFEHIRKVRLPNIKIIVTGGGRVANGAIETLGAMNIRKVTPFEFLHYSFREAVYTKLHSDDYYVKADGTDGSKKDFYEHPELYRSNFCDQNSYGSVCDILIHCSFWDTKAPQIFTKAQMLERNFRISMISDVTCDLNGSIPSTVKATTIENKFYGYNPETGSVSDPFENGMITVMSIDNLPCELPRDSSDGFGKHLMERVLPQLLSNEHSELIHRATIVEKGILTERFSYLKDYAEKE